jgi:hypothetical protein
MTTVGVRDKFNPLLIRESVGRAKCMFLQLIGLFCLGSYRGLPGLDFAYGNPNVSEPENARSVTSIWREHMPSKVKVDSNSVNFVSLNSKVAMNRRVSARLVNEMAKAVKVKQATRGKVGKPHNLEEEASVKYSYDKVYGMPTLIDVSIKDLVQNKFGNNGERETMEKYEIYRDKRMQEGKAHTTVKETRTSLRRAESLRVLQIKEPKEPFKMSKFKRIQSIIKLS